MRVITRIRQDEMLESLARLQEQVIGALPAVLAGASGETAERFFRSCIDEVVILSQAIDPDEGAAYIAQSYRASRRRVLKGMDSGRKGAKRDD